MRTTRVSLPAEASHHLWPLEESSDRQAFLSAPVGRFVLGTTYLVRCDAADLVVAIQWGEPGERDVRDMLAILELLLRADAARGGCVLLDYSQLERVDLDVVMGVAEAVAAWGAAPRARRQVVVVPNGVTGILIIGALVWLAPSRQYACVQELEEALAFASHPQARAAHAAATATAARVRGPSCLIGGLRAQLVRDLSGSTITSCAEALGLSPRTLQRRLTALGTSFKDELRRMRVATAEELLRRTNRKIEAIAASVGLGTASRLSAVLRRELKVTATELRARSQQADGLAAVP